MAFFDDMTQAQILLLYLATWGASIILVIIGKLLVNKFSKLDGVDLYPMLILALFGGTLLAIVFFRWLVDFGPDAPNKFGILTLVSFAFGVAGIVLPCIKIDIYLEKRKK